MIARRLPGFRFEAQPPPLPSALPRMDVAAFVGFAAAGPLNCPVPIEDATQFAAIFGGTVRLAWDAERSQWATSHLGPAVSAFLRNGGRRCWVVRVADTRSAVANRFAVPGVLAVYATDAPDGVRLEQAFAWARAEGSWSDALAVTTSLKGTLLNATGLAVETDGRLSLQTEPQVSVGDLLRLTPAGSGRVGFMAVESSASQKQGIGPDGQPKVITRFSGRTLWFAVPPEGDGSETVTDGEIRWISRAGEQQATVRVSGAGGEIRATLTMTGSADGAPRRGETVKIALPGRVLWMLITSAEMDGAQVRLTGQAYEVSSMPVITPDAELPCERLRLGIYAGGSSMPELDLVPAGPRFWAALPTDVERYATRRDFDPRREAYGVLWREAAEAYFPLAAADPGGDRLTEGEPLFTIPLLVDGLPEHAGTAQRLPGAALERDGLAEFSRKLFLDADLADTSALALMGQADDIRYLAPRTRDLQGIHAVLALDEVTIVAAPDAIHRPWDRIEDKGPDRPAESDPPLRPEWFGHPVCLPKPGGAIRKPLWERFLDCSVRVLEKPLWPDASPPGPNWVAVLEGAAITLEWEVAAVENPTYVLEEATLPDWEGAEVLYCGPQNSFTIYGRRPGDYYYRVRMEDASNTSDWSDGLPVRVGAVRGYALRALPLQPEPAYDLLSIQRGLVRMALARGDLFAVLSFPEHFRDEEALAHVGRLAPSAQPVFRTDAFMLDLPLGYGEAVGLSHAAAYHPWLIVRDETGLHAEPPDAAICGAVAQRALARGAWVAPANQVLQGPVALAIPALRPRQQVRWLEFQEAQINVVRQEPYGFVTLAADTLSLDPELRPINVRRLLHLLRRLALRLGSSFAFEPFGDPLRRHVRREVEGVLADLFNRGAFAGATPETSYQVAVRSTLQDVDQGRLIVEIRVAPSQPLAWVTVRLVQSGGRLTVTEEPGS